MSIEPTLVGAATYVLEESFSWLHVIHTDPNRYEMEWYDEEDKCYASGLLAQGQCEIVLSDKYSASLRSRFTDQHALDICELFFSRHGGMWPLATPKAKMSFEEAKKYIATLNPQLQASEDLDVETIFWIDKFSVIRAVSERQGNHFAISIGETLRFDLTDYNGIHAEAVIRQGRRANGGIR